MKAKDLRLLSEGELLIKEKELNEELFNLHFQHATGQLENVMRLPRSTGHCSGKDGPEGKGFG